MNRLLKIAGFCGLACLVYAALASITMIPPPFAAARWCFEEKTKAEPVSPGQANAFEASLALAERLSTAKCACEGQGLTVTSLGLLGLSCVCLVVGFQGNARKKPDQPSEPARGSGS